MIDLTKLSPAPWIVARREQQTATDQPTHGVILNARTLVQLDHEVALDADFAEFAAIARNAFDGDPDALAWWEANRKVVR